LKRVRNTKRVKSVVVFISSSKERELCEEKEDEDDDGCLSLLAALRVHHPPVLVLPLFSPLVLVREETSEPSFPERRNE